MISSNIIKFNNTYRCIITTSEDGVYGGGDKMSTAIQISNEFVEMYEQTLLNMVKDAFEKANNASTHKPYMNKKEAALYIGISFNTLQKFIEYGLPVIDVENVKLISKKDIDLFLEQNK